MWREILAHGTLLHLKFTPIGTELTMKTYICWLVSFAATYAARIAHVTHLQESDFLIHFAGRELTRYTYLIDQLHVYNSVQLVDNVEAIPVSPNGVTVFIANASQVAGYGPPGCLSTNSQGYCIDTSTAVHKIIGASSLSTGWGVYDYLSRLGLHFSSAGVNIPSSRVNTALETQISVTAEPIFDSVRGLQPFHDFSEGKR
jgi:hypothetical protein